MRSNIDTPNSNYLLSRQGIDARDLVWLKGRNRSTGLSETIGFWNDLDTVDITVVSGETGGSVTRSYIGSGTLLDIGPIPLVSDLTIQTVTLNLSHASEAVIAAVRQYEQRLALVDIHRLLLDLDSKVPVGVPRSHFFGRVNKINIRDPEPGSTGSIEVSCVSFLRELTRTNAAKRSDATQQLRGGDRFRRYSGTASHIEIEWSDAAPKKK